MKEHRQEVQVSENEIERQQEFVRRIREMNDLYYKENNRKKLLYAHTFGCQMNAHDSEKLMRYMLDMGYEISDDEKSADLILYNTCCVRENAEKRIYGKLGYLKHLKASRPDLRIVLCGCMMQQDMVIEELKKNHKEVDLIFGTFNLHRFPELLYEQMQSGQQLVDIWESHAEMQEEAPTVRKYRFKSGVNIMYGCDNFCSYCIVPYVRGRERSRQPEDILEEVRLLDGDGAVEIMLLGQNVNSYGRNLDQPLDFAELLYRMQACDLQNIQRIRFMTSHPKDLSPRLIEAMRDLPKVCHHLHLPFQSGSDRILRVMNRKYSKQDYLGLIEQIQKEIPDIALTTDIIVGFPGESEEDFLETLDVVDKVEFASAFTFLYSKRTGTPAARMEEQVPDAVVKERFNRLTELVNDKAHSCHLRQVGKTLPVLVEAFDKQRQRYTGRTEQNLLVHFPGEGKEEGACIGRIIPVKMTECKSHYLSGVKVQ